MDSFRHRSHIASDLFILTLLSILFPLEKGCYQVCSQVTDFGRQLDQVS